MAGQGLAPVRVGRHGLLALLLVLACVACGDGSLNALADAGGTASASPGKSRPLSAANYVLTEGAETVGLTPTVSPDAPTPPSSDVAGEKAFAQCMGLATDSIAVEPLDQATGVSFRNDAASLIVTSQAQVDTPQNAKTLLSTLSSPNLVRCQQAELAASSPTARITGLTSVPGPRGALATVRLTGTNGTGFSATPYIADLIYVGEGQITGSLLVMATEGLPNADLENRLVSQLTRKLHVQ
jgi:hypothetical protein